MGEREKESPFGPYRRPSRRDPFAPPGAEPAPAKRPPPRPRPLARPLDLLIEVAPGGAAFGHIPRLPGLCFRAGDVEQLARVAPAKVAEYARWLAGESLADLTPLAAAAVRLARAGIDSDLQVEERERRDGAPVWISGQPAALFGHDRRPLTDDEVKAHLRFARQVVRRIRLMVSGLADAERAWKPAPDRRSLDETLTHVGNCVWWYCSRLDDALPEPEAIEDEDPMARIGRLLEQAAGFLVRFPLSERAEIRVPARFLTADPREPWTHTKVCRRQAEHLWEHLQGLPRAVKMAAEA
jgi:hypothetical protein